MKIMALVSIFCFLGSCSTHHKQADVSPTAFEELCSDKAVTYSQMRKGIPSAANTDEMISEMNRLQPAVHACYQTYLQAIRIRQSFKLCLVVGNDTQGRMDFFEFSSKEIELSKDFKECLAELKNDIQLPSIKDVAFFQEFVLLAD